MKWFGRTWDGLVCVRDERIPVPVGEFCFACGREILRSSRGVMLDDRPVHLGCIHHWLAPL